MTEFSGRRSFRGDGVFGVTEFLLFFLCAGMRFVVDPGQMLEVEVGVDLCGCDIGVTEQFLNSAQVAG